MPLSVPYLAALLSIPFEDRYPPISDSPERQRERTLEVWKSGLADLAQGQPMIMLWEDLHWADPTTLDFINHLAEDLAQLPIFVLATAPTRVRPSLGAACLRIDCRAYAPRPQQRGCHRGALDGRQNGPAGDPRAHPAKERRQSAVYVEELTKATMESGLLLEQADRYVLTGPMRTLAVPSTLHDSLLARLDSLAVVKEVVQVGAAIGREFSLRHAGGAGASSARGIAGDAQRASRRGRPDPSPWRAARWDLHCSSTRSSRMRPMQRCCAPSGRTARPHRADPRVRCRRGRPRARAARPPPDRGGTPARAIPFLQQAGLLARRDRGTHRGLQALQRRPAAVVEAARRHDTQPPGARAARSLGMSLAATRGSRRPKWRPPTSGRANCAA